MRLHNGKSGPELVCRHASKLQDYWCARRGTGLRMTFFFTDHPLLGLGLVALVLGHAVALAWWVKQAMKPMARGSGDPWLLQKNK